MRLISCYIEGFGNIKKREFDLSSPLVEIYEQNGYGKSTLAYFIRAAFYGLPGSRDKARTDERKRYYPFDGGRFGGNLVFEYGGDTYRTERFFDKKSDTKDECRLFKNGREEKTDGKLGERFFGVDEESFVRTMFITAADTAMGATAGINKMLGGEGGLDEQNYKAARDVLTEAQKKLKGRGESGKIAEKKSRIRECEQRIANCEEIKRHLKLKYNERDGLAADIKKLEESLKTAQINERWKTYESYCSEAEKAETAMAGILDSYAVGLPDENEIRTLEECERRAAAARERLAATRLSDVSARRLAELEQRFKDGCPDDEEMAALNAERREIMKLSAGIENAERGQKALYPTDGEIEYLKERADKLREAKRAQKPEAKGKAPVVPIVIAVLAAIMIAAGAGLLFVNKIVGGALLGVGFIAISAALFIYFNGKIKAVNTRTNGPSVTDIENEMRGVLSRYGYVSQEGVEADFERMLSSVGSHIPSQDTQKKEDLKASTAHIAGAIARYGYDGEDLEEQFERFSTDRSEYLRLIGEEREVAERQNAIRQDILRHESQIRSVFDRYSITFDEGYKGRIEGFKEDRSAYTGLWKIAAAARNKANSYKAEYGLIEKPEGNVDESGTEDILREKRNRLARLIQEIGEDEVQAERLDTLYVEREGLKEEYDALNAEYGILTKTIEALDTAQGRLTAKYLSPVQDKFRAYVRPLENALGERVTMNGEYRLLFERSGENRDDRHLSSGQRSLCALCVRLAFLDGMYKNEQPFIIMDDPFVYLDEKHSERAVRLLNELKATRQIIYFCCHESRRIINE